MAIIVAFDHPNGRNFKMVWLAYWLVDPYAIISAA